MNLGSNYWLAAAFLICTGLVVFLIATLCSCGAIKENSHIVLTVSMHEIKIQVKNIHNVKLFDEHCLVPPLVGIDIFI